MRSPGYSAVSNMATRATQDSVRPDGSDSSRLGQEAGRPAPVEPFRSIARPMPLPISLPRGRTAPISLARANRPVGLFRKILLCDLTLWLVLTRGPTFQGNRKRKPPV